ncbi:putative mating locus protein [Aspergillus undulatus]|uniref:putative mating locus protein n=1 Tax=Aspergillus undulatus TaxID=1810928 RepID=UPI003CCDCC53
MNAYSHVIFRLLDATIGDAGLPLAVREQAAYISASFLSHHNNYRLMAQVSALFNGDKLLHASHRSNGLNENALVPVRRHGPILQAIANDYHVAPTVADFEGHPIELISILDPTIEAGLLGEKIFELHQALVSMERVANEDLARFTRQYGYHYIFRAGLNQYYMTKAVAEKVNFLRQDPRGNEYRAQAQRICYEAMENRPNLNDAEKNIVIRAVNCVPEDAHRFCKSIQPEYADS